MDATRSQWLVTGQVAEVEGLISRVRKRKRVNETLGTPDVVSL